MRYAEEEHGPTDNFYLCQNAEFMRKLLNHELNRLDQEEFKASDKIGVTVVLDNVRSQHNIGSVFRTADAFRVEKILLCGITATPPNREMQKTALGATETVSWQYFMETLPAVEGLRQQGYKVFVIEQTDDSIALEEFDPTPYGKIALVFGNEIHGVDENIVRMADARIEIPQFGTKHSLNISVTAGIVLWHVFQKLKSCIIPK
jgi:23S rRNA (guanosine2251-2'-O)-methyltransferase